MLRIGLIVPSSNTVMEPDFHRRLGGSCLISTTRIFLEDVTREAEIRMLEEDLPRAARLIGTTAPETVVFGCTSAGALGDLSHDDAIARAITGHTGARTVTVLHAVLAQLQKLNARSVAVLTPYVRDLTESIARSLTEGGFTIVKAAGMGIEKNLDIGKVTPDEIVRFAQSEMRGLHPDCLFLSCTNWRAMEAIQPLEEKLGVAVISSNQSAIENVSSR